MKLFYPTYHFHRITEITPSFLQQKGVQALFVDVDNTLTTHNNPVPMQGILDWITMMQQNGIQLFVISNNRYDRVKAFCSQLQLPFVCNAKKPLPIRIKKACKNLSLLPKDVAIVGDQIFTDILCGNLFSCISILVDPIELEEHFFFRIKRKLERSIYKG